MSGVHYSLDGINGEVTLYHCLIYNWCVSVRGERVVINQIDDSTWLGAVLQMVFNSPLPVPQEAIEALSNAINACE